MKIKNKELMPSSVYINGEWKKAKSGKKIAVYNKANGEIIGEVPDCGEEECVLAIDGAKKAQNEWAKLTPKDRGLVLGRWHDLILENLDDLITILSLEQGKPKNEARGEILNGLSYIDWYREEARRFYGEIIPSPRPDSQPMLIYQPIGVVGAITPWNFPSSMVTRKASPALAAACSFIVKPASATPFSALALAYLADKAEFIPGLFSVITGDADLIGNALCASKDIRAISFTGSTKVGKKIMAQCSTNVKKLALELGGNAPFIIFEKADLDKSIDALIACKFRNAGQTCICANRIFVHKSLENNFLEKFIKKIKEIIPGAAANPDSTMGPLINSKAITHMEELIADAISKGAELKYGGKKSKAGNNFFEPTIITKVTEEMRLFQEEIFGPIAPIITFTDDDEVINMANDTEYGLASYLFSQDLAQVWKASQALDFGMVGVNEVGLASGETPFGGIKESGLGREGGRQGLKEFMEEKFVLLGGLN